MKIGKIKSIETVIHNIHRLLLEYAATGKHVDLH